MVAPGNKNTVHTFRNASGTYLDVPAAPKQSAFLALYLHLKTSGKPLDAQWVLTTHLNARRRFA